MNSSIARPIARLAQIKWEENTNGKLDHSEQLVNVASDLLVYGSAATAMIVLAPVMLAEMLVDGALIIGLPESLALKVEPLTLGLFNHIADSADPTSQKNKSAIHAFFDDLRRELPNQPSQPGLA